MICEFYFHVMWHLIAIPVQGVFSLFPKALLPNFVTTLGVDKVCMYTHTYSEEKLSDHPQSPAWQSTLRVAWCLLWKRVWSYMTPNVLTETRCHAIPQTPKRLHNTVFVVHKAQRFCSLYILLASRLWVPVLTSSSAENTQWKWWSNSIYYKSNWS